MRFLPHLAIILLSSFTLLWRIDATLLWRDEASTASWAREMIAQRSLVPRVFNGERLIVQAADGHDFDDRFLPVMQGWLQFYVAALGLLVGGVGTVSARLPFVLAGAASLWVLYRAGRQLFGPTRAALGAPLLGAVSIYFLTAARQARYYVLVVLLTSLVLLEFCRYFRDPERARSPGFYARLGAYGVLVYLANYMSFAGLWASLWAFALVRRDGALLRRFAALTALLGVILAAHFFAVHAGFVANSPATMTISWANWRAVTEYHWSEMWRMIPLLGIVPAAWWVFGRRRQRGPAAEMALLCSLVVVVSVAVTVAVARTGAISRYYFQVVPALLLLAAILAERLAALAGRAWAAAFFLFAAVWPNLNFYHGWSVHAAERQLTRDTAEDAPIVEFLRRNVPPGKPWPSTATSRG